MAQRPGKQSEREVDGPREPGAAEPGGVRGPLPELVRKAVAMGFSGFFFTEEVIRKALGETLPRDWADFAADQSERARAEFLERLSYEIGRAMENVDYAAVLAQLLEGRTLEVSATIRLSDKDKSGRQGLRFDLSRKEEDTEGGR